MGGGGRPTSVTAWDLCAATPREGNKHVFDFYTYLYAHKSREISVRSEKGAGCRHHRDLLDPLKTVWTRLIED